MGLLLTLLLFLFTCTVYGAPLSLSDAHQLALNNSERLAQRVSEVTQAYARYDELFSAVLPRVSVIGTQRSRNTANAVGIQGDVVNVPARNIRALSVTLRQPIFSGFREFLLADAAKSDASAATFTQLRFREELYQEVAQVYLQVALFQEDIEILRVTESILHERVRELRRFVELGRSRTSEILQAEADIAENKAVVARSRGLLAAARELLSFFVGKTSDDLVVQKLQLPVAPLPVDEYVTRVDTRTDLLALQQSLSSLQYQKTAAERERWPVISLEVNSYLYDHPEQNREWDLLLRAEVPLFEGGAISARIAQSEERIRQSELALKERKRSAVQQVRSAWQQVQAGTTEVNHLKEYVRRSTQSYEALKRDYALGQLTNLEVLNAIRQVEGAKRTLLDAEARLSLATVSLEVAVGGLPLRSSAPLF